MRVSITQLVCTRCNTYLWIQVSSLARMLRDRSSRSEVVDEVRCCRCLASTTKLHIQHKLAYHTSVYQQHKCSMCAQVYSNVHLYHCVIKSLRAQKQHIYFICFHSRTLRAHMPVSTTKFFHVRDSTQMRTSNFA